MKALVKSKKLIRQIQTRFALSETQIVIATLGVSIVLARFGYIYFLENDIQGSYLGYRWLSTFLYMVGIEVAFIALGILMYYSTNFMMEAYRKAYKNVSILVIITGCFFLFWAVYTHILDYSLYTEIVFGLATSFMFVSLFLALSKAAKTYVQKLKEAIKILIDALARKAPQQVKDIEVYDAEVLWPTLDKVTDEI
jgi:hypothetical protein